jgi:hypothetical protein
MSQQPIVASRPLVHLFADDLAELIRGAVIAALAEQSPVAPLRQTRGTRLNGPRDLKKSQVRGRVAQ